MTTPVTGMVAGCLVSWLAVSLAFPDLAPEVAAGMAGPLLAVVVTWMLVVRAHRANPAGVTPVMMQAFIAKMVFFALYVTAMLAGLGLDPARFAISFAVYFLVLYTVEAVLLQRLFSGAPDGATR